MAPPFAQPKESGGVFSFAAPLIPAVPFDHGEQRAAW
jgi:hypothetical protein